MPSYDSAPFMALFGRRPSSSLNALSLSRRCSKPIRTTGSACFRGHQEPRNGDYRGELRQAVKAISGYVKAQSLPLNQAVVRLDGQYGNGAIVADLVGLGDAHAGQRL